MEQNLQKILNDRFGLTSFRRGQKEILTSVLGGSDTLAVMPTGGGKSLCYQLPAFCREGIVLVVSPLISLMRDQVEALKQQGVPAGSLHSNQTLEEKKQVFKEMGQSKSFLLYLSPERVQKPGFQAWFQKAGVSLIAIDEAHCLSQWGPDFRQDYYKLSLLRQIRKDIPILALTATATPLVLGDISRQLSLSGPQRHIYGFYRPNLYYQVEFCESEHTKFSILSQALEDTHEGRVIVYCGTRKQTQELAEEFDQKTDGVGFYHAGLSSEKRTQIQDQYRSGKIRMLFATNAFGMGVDQPDVRLVIHYQMPANIESFYQEMGRAGRDGKESTCLLLYSKKDKGLHAYFLKQSDADPEIINRRWRALDTIVQYVEGGECRHGGILTYFRDTQRIDECGHCDVCDSESPRRIKRPSFAIEPAKKSKSKKATKKKSTQEPLTKEQEMRREVIREWRLDFSKEHDVPAFIVFSNKTLDDLAVKNPQSTDELLNIYGLGSQKVETFGSKLLELLKTLDC